MHLGRLPAFAVVDRAPAVVGAHAAAIDAVVQGVPFGEVGTATVPAFNPDLIHFAVGAGPGRCVAAVGLVGFVLGEVLRRDHAAARRWAMVAGQGAVAAGDDVLIDKVGGFDAVGQRLGNRDRGVGQGVGLDRFEVLGNAVGDGCLPGCWPVQADGWQGIGCCGGVEQAVGLGLEQVAETLVFGKQVEAEGEYREYAEYIGETP